MASDNDDWVRRWPGRSEIRELLRHLPAVEPPAPEPRTVGVEGASPSRPGGPRSTHEFDDFYRDLHRLGFIKVFDWPGEQHELMALQADPERLARADLTDLVKLLTMHVRGDRFSDGHLQETLENGGLAAILRRIAAIDELLDGAAVAAQRLIEDREGLASR